MYAVSKIVPISVPLVFDKDVKCQCCGATGRWVAARRFGGCSAFRLLAATIPFLDEFVSQGRRLTQQTRQTTTLCIQQ